MLKDIDEEYRTTLINLGKYKLIMFAIAKIIEKEVIEQNQVALYLFNYITPTEFKLVVKCFFFLAAWVIAVFAVPPDFKYFINVSRDWVIFEISEEDHRRIDRNLFLNIIDTFLSSFKHSIM